MKRFWEIDFFRGIAIVFMVVFNYSVTLRYFNLYPAGGSWEYQWLLPRLIASAFILLAGVSLQISWSKTPSAKRILMRGGRIFVYGMIITAVTWLFFPQYAILFGILHLIGISIILSVPFLKKRIFLLPAIVLAAGGFCLESLGIKFSSIFFLIPQDFRTFDYFPVIPWFGVFLLGIFLGNRLYDGEKRKYKFVEAPEWSKLLSFLGRHSLVIYFIHQPLFLSALYAAGYIAF